MMQPGTIRVRRSRRFDMLRTAGEMPDAPWNTPRENPFVDEPALEDRFIGRIPGAAPALDVPFDYFQRERTPLMSRRVNGETVSYPVSSKNNKHFPAGYLGGGSKNAEASRSAVSRMIRSGE